MEKEKINPHVEELFTVMHEIDERVKMVKKEAIMLVGLTRVGKSTCYNWALNHPLKSEKEIIRKIYKGVERVTEGSVIYLPEVKLTDSAEVQPGFKSCTQVPNIIDLNPDISLIDTAGFGDSRNYVGTLAVSYSLKAIFEAVDKVKFIIVLNESKLESRTDLCNTFNHFLSMFNFQMYPQSKQKIFNATSLLITSSKNPQLHYNRIQTSIANLDDQAMQNIENRKLIVELMQDILYEGRFGEFLQAQMGQQPEKCEVFKRFDQLGWQYFDLQEYRPDIIDKKPIEVTNLPFEGDFKVLIQEQKDRFINGIDKRLNSYKNFTDIFSVMFDEVLLVDQINDIKLPYKIFYEKIDKFILENDHYNSQKFITSNQLLLRTFCKPQREALLKLILNLNKIGSFQNMKGEDNLFESSISTITEIFNEKFNEMIDVITSVFCRNKGDYKKILQVKFILLRGIREFYMLLHVDHSKVRNSVNIIHDSLEGIFNYSVEIIISNFLASFNLDCDQRVTFGPRNPKNTMEGYLLTRESTYAMEILLKTYEIDILRLGSQYLDQYYQILRDIKLIHAKYEFQKYQFHESCSYLIEAINLESKFERNYIKRRGEEFDQSEIDVMVKAMYVNQENIFSMIKENFVKMKNYSIALTLSIQLHWVHSACEIYDLILTDKNTSKEDIILYTKEYAIYCMNTNRREKGFYLFHQLLELHKEIENKKEILKTIHNYIEKPQDSKEKYSTFLNSYFIDLLDATRENLIKSIEQALVSDNFDINQIIEASKDYLQKQQFQLIEESDPQTILREYLKSRASNEAMINLNGFRTEYLSSQASKFKEGDPKYECCSTIDVRNSQQLKQLSVSLLQILEKISKSLIKSNKEKYILIHVSAMTIEGISNMDLAIVLRNQNITPTYEYAVKTMKNIKRLVYEPHHRLRELIICSKESIVRVKRELQYHFDMKYGIGAQIKSMIEMVHKNPKDDNIKLLYLYFELYPDSELVDSEIYQIFDEIRLKTSTVVNKYVMEEAKKLLDESLTRESEDMQRSRRY